jgi:hypothetical protein
LLESPYRLVAQLWRHSIKYGYIQSNSLIATSVVDWNVLRSCAQQTGSLSNLAAVRIIAASSGTALKYENLGADLEYGSAHESRARDQETRQPCRYGSRVSSVKTEGQENGWRRVRRSPQNANDHGMTPLARTSGAGKS